MNIQVISIFGSIIFTIFVLELIRRKKLKEAYALIWLGMSLVFVVLACWVEALIWVSKQIGIVYPPATLFLFMLVSLVLILIQFSVIISKQADKIREVAQETALLKERLEKLEKKD